MKVHAQVWLNPVILADLIRWERSQGYKSPRLATSLSVLLTILRDSLQKQFQFTSFRSEPEALQYLADQGIISTVRTKNMHKPIEAIVEIAQLDSQQIAKDLLEIMEKEVK